MNYSEIYRELTRNILPFWSGSMMDMHEGGFYGRIDGNGMPHPKADKGIVLNARILWTFSAAYRVIKRMDYLDVAERAYNYIRERFIDDKYGGVYWMLNNKGEPINTKKQTYAQCFAIYGLYEFWCASGNSEAMSIAIDLFRLIEDNCRDRKNGGYFEAFSRDWGAIDDVRLSEKDANEQKSMNTHLHILEAYTGMCLSVSSHELMQAQSELIQIFTDKIVRQNGHLGLFFDEEWNIKSDDISYGHDIEASWLLYEAAEALENQELISKIAKISQKIADAAAEGIGDDGGMAYECKNGIIDYDRHWWVQAEAVAGYIIAYRNTQDRRYSTLAKRAMQYIKHNVIDFENGEWFWSLNLDGSANRIDDKAGPWKCPYHNGRMCLVAIKNHRTLKQIHEDNKLIVND
ncbi:MAG: AGE family epimerase/isomerase [Prevotellaceae bacterium]|jgi:mannobiose 2-epimerase|nr:AGE family epimerase/isomerase [Prevotellaceae bacterium]